MLIFQGCPEDFISYNEGCYGFITKDKTWSEAQSYCNEIDTGFYSLVTINDQNENDFLTKHIKENYPEVRPFWIGLKEDGTKGQYVWTDNSNLDFGEPLGEGPWMPGQPNAVITLAFSDIQS